MESASGESRKGRLESHRPAGTAGASNSNARPLGSSAIPQPASNAGRSIDRPAPLGVSASALANRVCPVINGNAGDHTLVHVLLRAANQSPTYEEFLASLDEPTYEPSDRLLVKQGGQLVAHLQVLDRLAWFAGVRLPVAGVQDLAVLPEYRDAGLDRALIAVAEQAMRDRQAIVSFTRTQHPEAFRAAGWIEVRNQSTTQANVHEILARLPPLPPPGSRRERSLHTRLWRQVELDALTGIYSHSHATAWGALERAEPYWRWLVNRKAHDELIVAVHGKDEWAELDSPAHIVGYAVMLGPRVVELCTLPNCSKVALRLLARACQDAIEQGYRDLELQLPTDHSLHELLLSAGGCWSNSAGGGVSMLKLLDPVRWIECMYPALVERAKMVDLARPFHVSFDAGPRRYRLELTRRSGHLVRDNDPAADVASSWDTFCALLLGNLDVHTARAAGDLQIESDATAEHVAAIFPPTAFWQSSFDGLRI